MGTGARGRGIHVHSNHHRGGRCVAIDGDTCVIGAFGTNSKTGSAYVYCSASGQTGVAGDLDGDGDVDTDDLDIMQSNLSICPSDTDHDGDTDIDDLLDVVEGWGITCH
ncbi:MAG: FG-GAP repeat protein [Planctomycetota bacterium]|nr:FG-GAP repeat protein [Planctomycetota bacterium]